MRRRAALLLLSASLLGSACAPLVVGGAAFGGALVALDRRSSGAQIDDQAIELRAPRRLADVLETRGHVSVTSYNRVVLLSGEVPTEGDRLAAEHAMATTEAVLAVVNELSVGAESSTTSRSKDLLLTAKVKATLVRPADIPATAIKVVSERGIVYLLGLLTEAEAERVTNLVRRVPGVQRVVRVFQIVSVEELKAMGHKPTVL